MNTFISKFTEIKNPFINYIIATIFIIVIGLTLSILYQVIFNIEIINQASFKI